jgi:chromosomal replication initiator protein
MVAPPMALRRHDQTSLNPTFTFAEFVSGKANQLARAAGMQVADHPTSYNPLFIYGGVGLGKTHLVQAIGNHILDGNPTAKIRYIHAETMCRMSFARISTRRSTISSATTVA